MYKIHINVSLIIFCPPANLEALRVVYPGALVLQFLTGKKQLLNYIDMLEKRTESTVVLVYSEDWKMAYNLFKSLYVFIRAAGGLILNKEGKMLAIFRRGHWDMPKGTVEVGESIKEAAVREVQEETGLMELDVLKKLGNTYHTYHTNKYPRKLKKTHWYLMETQSTAFKLEHEEDIEHAIWVDPGAFLKEMVPIYQSIQDIVRQYLDGHKKKA